jgi:hypothetical protein
LVAGVVLVLVSVIAGARIVSGADQRLRVVVLTHDLQAGSRLTVADLDYARAQLPSRGQSLYVDDFSSAIGKQLNQAVGRGEFLARSAIGVPAAAVTVVVPLAAGAAPRLAAGQRVEVWLSTAACPAVVLLSDVTVQSVRAGEASSFGPAGGQTVVVSVEPALAQRVIEALALDGAVLRAGELNGPIAPPPGLSDLTACRERKP